MDSFREPNFIDVSNCFRGGERLSICALSTNSLVVGSVVNPDPKNIPPHVAANLSIPFQGTPSVSADMVSKNKTLELFTSIIFKMDWMNEFDW